MGTDRSTIEEKYKWKIDKMYSSKEEIEKDISKVKNLIQEVKEYKGNFLRARKTYIKY